jgi:hypothetical protein
VISFKANDPENAVSSFKRTTDRYAHLPDEALGATDTIFHCAMCQKRIIDDILKPSRRDLNLLLVSPEPAQPVQPVQSVLKIFHVPGRIGRSGH